MYIKQFWLLMKSFMKLLFQSESFRSGIWVAFHAFHNLSKVCCLHVPGTFWKNSCVAVEDGLIQRSSVIKPERGSDAVGILRSCWWNYGTLKSTPLQFKWDGHISCITSPDCHAHNLETTFNKSCFSLRSFPLFIYFSLKVISPRYQTEQTK